MITNIGHSGFLGSYLSDRFNTWNTPARFEYSQDYWSWLASNYHCDYVLYCARACRKNTPRRDRDTLLLETEGITKALNAYPNAHFIYCSTKVVDNWTNDWERFITRSEIGDYIDKILAGKYRNKTIHLPEINQPLIGPKLNTEHLYYAKAKSIGETLVKSCAKNYTILRIWDITQ